MSSDDRDPRPGETPGHETHGAGYGRDDTGPLQPGPAAGTEWYATPGPGPGATQAYGQPAPYGAPPPPGWVPGYLPARPTNGMAIASLVLGILWLYWVGSILALVFGYVAKRQIEERGEQGGGMATAGIVLGWIGIGVLALMIVFFVGFAALGAAGGY